MFLIFTNEEGTRTYTASIENNTTIAELITFVKKVSETRDIITKLNIEGEYPKDRLTFSLVDQTAQDTNLNSQNFIQYIKKKFGKDVTERCRVSFVTDKSLRLVNNSSSAAAISTTSTAVPSHQQQQESSTRPAVNSKFDELPPLWQKYVLSYYNSIMPHYSEADKKQFWNDYVPNGGNKKLIDIIAAKIQKEKVPFANMHATNAVDDLYDDREFTNNSSSTAAAPSHQQQQQSSTRPSVYSRFEVLSSKFQTYVLSHYKGFMGKDTPDEEIIKSWNNAAANGNNEKLIRVIAAKIERETPSANILPTNESGYNYKPT